MDRKTKSLAPVALSDESLTAASGAGLPLIYAPVYAPKSNFTSQSNAGLQVVGAAFAAGPVSALMGQSNSSISVNG